MTTSGDRFALLAAVAEVADGRLTLADTAARVCGLVVPEFADICVIDVVHESSLRRLAVRASGVDAAELESRLLLEPSSAIEASATGAAIRSGVPQLSQAVRDQPGPPDTVDQDLPPELHAAARIVIPLSARGRTLGAVTLLHRGGSGGSYDEDDLGFFTVFAGRVALALDNAGLFMELQTMEAQLSVALGALGEAVTIQNLHGNLIYANQAAAEMMGAESPAAVLARSADELVGRYDYYHEDGTPLDPSAFPGRQILAGTEPQPLVMRVVDRATGDQRWRSAKASAVRDSTGRLVMVVNVVADITAVKRAELSQRLLARAGELLNSTLELEDTLEQLARLCVPDLADWCTVRLADRERRRLTTVAVAHSDRARVARVQESGERYPVGFDDEGGLAHAYRSGEPVCFNGITDEMLVATARDPDHLELMRSLAPHATLIVPMRSRRATTGVLTLVHAESGRSFDSDDVELVSELARRAATAVENARVYTERSTIASTLQDSLLPEAMPTLPGWRTATLYRPAGQEDRVGGDFFDALPLGAGAWMLLVGDVTGRGARAAALTAMMRHTVRAIATFTGSATAALEKLNRDLAERPRLTLCTAVCVVLRDHGRDHATAEIYCAGHPLPVLSRHGSARLVGEYGQILGADSNASFEPSTVTIEPGDLLMLYSDGVPDTVGAEERFGVPRLLDAVSSASSAQQAVAGVERALASFEVGPAADDVALLAIERVAGGDAADVADETERGSGQHETTEA